MSQWLSTLTHHSFEVRNTLEPRMPSKLQQNNFSAEEPITACRVTNENPELTVKEKRPKSPINMPDSVDRTTKSNHFSKTEGKDKRHRHSSAASNSKKRVRRSSKSDVKQKYTSPFMAILDSTKITHSNKSSESDAEDEESLKCDLDIPPMKLGIIPELKSIQDIGKSMIHIKPLDSHFDHFVHRKARRK